MKKSIFLSVLVVIFAVVLIGCKKKDDPAPPPTLSSLKVLTHVSANGGTWSVTGLNYSGTNVPTENLSAVTLTFTVSEGATPDPVSPATFNFNEPGTKTIKVTAADGTSNNYTVTASSGGGK